MVIEEIVKASTDDDLETVSSIPDMAVSTETGRLHRLESPSATVLPEPAGLRSTSELDSPGTGGSISSLATR